MKIKTRDVDSIGPHEKNPRQNAGAVDAVDAVAKSVEQFGRRQLIVINTSGDLLLLELKDI